MRKYGIQMMNMMMCMRSGMCMVRCAQNMDASASLARRPDLI